MQVTELLLNLFFASYYVSEDTPMARWRDPIKQPCLDRECVAHESCARREAIIAFVGWYYQNTVR